MQPTKTKAKGRAKKGAAAVPVTQSSAVVKRSGRASGELRDKLTDSFEQRLGILEAIADGEPTEEMRLEVRELLEHVECPGCQGKLKPKRTHDLVKITVVRSARPGDRIKAVDIIGKHGPGQKIDNEITIVSPEVQTRIADQLAIMSSRPSWDTEELLAKLSEVWK